MVNTSSVNNYSSKTKNDSLSNLSLTATDNSNSDLIKKIQVGLRKQGLADVRVVIEDEYVVLRGYIPRGRMADALITAHQIGNKKVKNELLER
jgi:hypothetical protein